jgi:hypothetical protein
MIDDNILIVSDWGEENKGVLVRLNINDKTLETVQTDFFGGPADLYVNDKNELLIPVMAEGKVVRQKITAEAAAE